MLKAIASGLVYLLLFISIEPSYANNPPPFSNNELLRFSHYLFANIASAKNPLTKMDQGKTLAASEGAIFASSSNPYSGFSQDYQFHWMRDAAITMQQVISMYLQEMNNPQLRDQVNAYIAFERQAQQQPSKVGENTLGQPKFNVDTTVWEGRWGRPQNDGPALRAYTLCYLAQSLLDRHVKQTSTWVQQQLLPLMLVDSNYVVKYWAAPNYDLWEEVNDKDHFFTKMMQIKNLNCVANLLLKLDDKNHVDLAQTYQQTAEKLSQTLEKHWHPSLGYITDTLHQLNNKGGGLDSSILFSVLYANAYGDTPTGMLKPWSVNNDRVMRTVAALRDAFAKEYPINQRHPKLPPLIGRYPGDRYDGNHFVRGNPWVITTSAMAEYYYTLGQAYLSAHEIDVTPNNIHFFSQLHLSLSADHVYRQGSDNYNKIVVALFREGDRMLRRIKQYQVCEAKAGCLHFAEQIDAVTGQQVSAKELTWGYVSLLRAMHARDHVAHALEAAHIQA